jgi:transaldolase/glucose-6-phosphate isomerase
MVLPVAFNGRSKEAAMTANPLKALTAAGQAIWLDYMHQDLLKGELQRLIAEDGLTGLTSNPSIFEKAIGDGEAYDARIGKLLAAGKTRAADLYEGIAIGDIQGACDQLRPTWGAMGGRDGYASLEVSPDLADDTEGTVAQARRLWKAVDRPNLMIKGPGATAGTPAIRTLIGEGINVNVTLLFGLQAYLDVADAHIAGLEDLKAKGGDVSKVHGVASFFVSRIDTAIDKQIDDRLKTAEGQTAARLKSVRGQVAIANAKVAYQRFLELMGTARWQALAAAGAAPQRLLWASTGTKDPSYSDVLYVDSLIGPNTVNTLPPKTLDAFRDHGKVAPTLTDDVEGANAVLAEAKALGLDLDTVTDALVVDGVKQFAKAFDGLLAAVEDKRARLSEASTAAHG